VTAIPTKLTLAAERRRFAAHLAQIAAERGWSVERNEEAPGDRYRTLRLQGPELAVLVHLGGRGGVDAPLLHWHGAKRELAGVDGAWAWASVNRHHRHKATSFPMGTAQLADMLTRGIEAANDGSAFLD
jgi:hypothetical protein